MKLKHAFLALFLFVIPIVSQAEEVDQSIPRYIAEQAKANGVDVQMALYVSWKESHWNCSAKGDYDENGTPTSFGCWQIHNPTKKKVRPLTIEQAKDLYISTYWAMQTMIEDGGCRQWSTCPSRDT